MRELCATFLETARSHVGYTSLADRNSIFGQTVGHPNRSWSGSFVDVVARAAGVQIPACVYPPAGLAEFFHARLIHERPAPGDIVFFAAATDLPFGMPSVGIVTETGTWKTDRAFKAVVGQTSTGLPRGSQDVNGVYERTYYQSDVICFGRPFFHVPKVKKQDEPVTDETSPLPQVRPSQFVYGKLHGSVVFVQLALTKLGMVSESDKGRFDAKTKSAFARYQRSIGLVPATGVPDEYSLRQLGLATGLFRV